jgi:hypothetical protein
MFRSPEYGSVGAWDTWMVYASSGEYPVPAETLGHALLRFIERHPDDFVHAIVVEGMQPPLVRTQTPDGRAKIAEGQYDEDAIWPALDTYGFDPGYQEVMVTIATTKGEYLSTVEDGSNRHIHLTYNKENEIFTLRAAGPECPHNEEGDDRS